MKRNNILELALVTGLVVAILCGAAAEATQNKLSDKLLRLHIIANSDSNEDQALKLKVRDRVVNEVKAYTKNVKNISSAQECISENMEALRCAAQDEVTKNGYSYPVRVEIKKVYFPTREYDTFSLPAGYYNAFRVIIGNGDGHNWWCVLFPPLCISAAEAEFQTAAKDAGLTKEEIDLISSGKTVYRFKFKSIEIIEKFLKIFNK